jgi:hypothetical protein
MRIEQVTPELFISGPAEYLCAHIASELSLVPQWFSVFNEYIDGYKRMDYPVRALPALRIYNEEYVKTFESWFIEGDILLDVIWPATLRREDTQKIPDFVSSALLQQFRRVTFFTQLCSKIPGLNELGKTFSVDKGLGFEWEDTYVPLTQIKANFKIDLREWDLFLENDSRTKDEPFARTLRQLESISTEIRDTVEINIEQRITP